MLVLTPCVCHKKKHIKIYVTLVYSLCKIIRAFTCNVRRIRFIIVIKSKMELKCTFRMTKIFWSHTDNQEICYTAHKKSFSTNKTKCLLADKNFFHNFYDSGKIEVYFAKGQKQSQMYVRQLLLIAALSSTSLHSLCTHSYN